MRRCHMNLHLKFQLSIFNISRENHICSIALQTDWRTDKVEYRVALLLKITTNPSVKYENSNIILPELFLPWWTQSLEMIPLSFFIFWIKEICSHLVYLICSMYYNIPFSYSLAESLFSSGYAPRGPLKGGGLSRPLTFNFSCKQKK